MQIGYLGPLEVRDGERIMEVPRVRLRRLLVRLVLDVGRPVSPRTLTEAVWPDDVPADPVNALQSLVSRLRRTLGDASLVEQAPGGYRLSIDPADVDAVRFARLAATAHDEVQRGSDDAASAAIGPALELWRADPLDGDDDPALDPVRARLGELHLQVLADRIGVALRAGRAGAVLPELEQLVAAHPLREDLVALQLNALVQLGRPAEALAVYEVTRRFLAETLGSDPSPALQATHLGVLRHQAPTGGGRTNLRAPLTSFVGAGGAGKTRLASEVAAGWVSRMRDGVWFAELAPVSDPDNIALAVLDGIGVGDVRLLEQWPGERPPREARTRVLEALADAESLVVIDNCEHDIDAAADLVADLLGRCPGVRVIASSREPLGVDGEVLYPLTPLAIPDGESDPALDLDRLAGVAAVRLLLDRARSAGAPLGQFADRARPPGRQRRSRGHRARGAPGVVLDAARERPRRRALAAVRHGRARCRTDALARGGRRHGPRHCPRGGTGAGWRCAAGTHPGRSAGQACRARRAAAHRLDDAPDRAGAAPGPAVLRGPTRARHGGRRAGARVRRLVGAGRGAQRPAGVRRAFGRGRSSLRERP